MGTLLRNRRLVFKNNFCNKILYEFVLYLYVSDTNTDELKLALLDHIKSNFVEKRWFQLITSFCVGWERFHKLWWNVKVSVASVLQCKFTLSIFQGKQLKKMPF